MTANWDSISICSYKKNTLGQQQGVSVPTCGSEKFPCGLLLASLLLLVRPSAWQNSWHKGALYRMLLLALLVAALGLLQLVSAIGGAIWCCVCCCCVGDGGDGKGDSGPTPQGTKQLGTRQGILVQTQNLKCFLNL